MSVSMREGTKGMDCTRFEGLVHDLGRRRGLDVHVREEALAHADSCAPCAQLLAEAERLDFALRYLAAEQKAGRAGDLAQPRVEAALVAEFKAVKSRASRWNARWHVAAIATAAMLFLTIGLAWRHFAPRPDKTGPGTGPNVAVAMKSTAPAVPGDAAFAVAENQNGAQFIRLPYANDGTVVEDDAIVRANMPRSALASLGFPMGDVSGTEAVPVELMVSEDGTPEAIRLVAQDVQE
jgi:hypothetical protein